MLIVGLPPCTKTLILDLVILEYSLLTLLLLAIPQIPLQPRRARP